MKWVAVASLKRGVIDPPERVADTDEARLDFSVGVADCQVHFAHMSREEFWRTQKMKVGTLADYRRRWRFA